MDKVYQVIQQKFHLSNKTRLNLPWCSGQRYTRDVLAQVFAELGFNLGAEIGVRRGRFSQILCRANPYLKMICIDSWKSIDAKYPQERQDQLYADTIKRMRPYGATILRKTSMEGLSDVGERSLDFVFIDADHHFDVVVVDIIEWSKKVKRGGIVACHDAYGGEVGVRWAVEGYVNSHDIRPWYITKELQPTAYWVNP